TAEMPNLVAPGLDSTDDIRGGLGYSGLANLEKFVQDGGLLIAGQSSAGLTVSAGMTEIVQVSDARQMQAPGSVLLSTGGAKTRKVRSRMVMMTNFTSIFAKARLSASGAAWGALSARMPAVPRDVPVAADQ